MNSGEWNPGKLLGLSGAYWQGCTLQAGVKLGVFTRIGDRALTAEEITRELQGDPRGVSMLLNALAAMDLLHRAEDRYSNTEAAKKFLVEGSSAYLGYIIRHHYHLLEAWSRLDQAVLSGKPTRSRTAFEEPEVREAFLLGMFNMAMILAPRVAEAVDLSGSRHLLDLGGGPGTYAIHFCLKNPRLRATVYDLPATRPFAGKTIDKFSLSDRIQFHEGDYLEKAVEGRYDVVWLSQVLHGEGPDDAQEMISKAVSVLEPGGRILVHDFLLNDNLDGPLFPAVFSLNMLVNTEAGQSYSEQQIRDMLDRAGVVEIKRIPLITPNDSGIIQGIRP